MLVSCYSKPLQCSLKKPQIKHDFFKNEGVILEKLIQVNLELVFFCDFYFLPTEFRAWKAKNLLNLAREFCRNFVEQNLNENQSSDIGGDVVNTLFSKRKSNVRKSIQHTDNR